MLHDNIAIGKNGHLFFAGMDTVELAKKHGTPLYLIDENKIRENCRVYIECVKKYFGAKSIPLFASKSLCFLDLYRILKEEGNGCRRCFGGEVLYRSQGGLSCRTDVFPREQQNLTRKLITRQKRSRQLCS
jgi:diaminopimelate decarboxylase